MPSACVNDRDEEATSRWWESASTFSWGCDTTTRQSGRAFWVSFYSKGPKEGNLEVLSLRSALWILSRAKLAAGALSFVSLYSAQTLATMKTSLSYTT